MLLLLDETGDDRVGVVDLVVPRDDIAGEEEEVLLLPGHSPI